jgi:hypothetical protein
MLSRFPIACVALSLFFLPGMASAVTVTYQHLPAPPFSPVISLGISATSGPLVVGGYFASADHTQTDGFIFNGTTWTVLSDPASTGLTTANGISGNTVSGSYYDSAGAHGFLYDIPTSQYTTFDDPAGSNDTKISTIVGNEIVGFLNGGTVEGFVYNTTTGQNTIIADPLAAYGTVANDIFGNTVAGTYYDSNTLEHGFLYNMSTGVYTTLNDPSAITSFTTIQQHYEGTSISGISSQYIVGSYADPNSGGHGFIYNLATGAFSAVVDHSGVEASNIAGITGNVIVGTEVGQAFIATLPEPSSLVLAAFGAAGLFLAARRRNA